MALNNLRITTKFTILLLILLVAGILSGAYTFREALLEQTQREITSQAELLTSTMNSVRTYTSSRIRPLLSEELATSLEFIPETVPAFSARTVFEQFRQYEDFNTFYYKEATLNPMNPLNKVDEFEADLVNQMRADADITELSGYRELSGQEVFYIARPLSVGNESCLGCHYSPDEAPTNLIASYGAENGFGWELNEIVAAQMIYVPSETLLDKSNEAFSRISAIFIAVIVSVILVINFMLRRFVILPVDEMGKLAHMVASDENLEEGLASESLNKITQRGDELGELGRVFKRMVVEIHERTQNLKQQLRSLRIEIDEIKKQEQIEDVVESPFFKDLQSKARELKKNDDDDSDSDVAKDK